ncbi:hypothetical protein IC757_03490 [Wenzhouxiangella sp. AB-CW3]|uniref:hypothetical protein n=1 Tax=Wenzhouxiangella sp. AB-CW3 TaxID=2771012 RepID=UPI00168BD73F|nr:hypothetical protein [Wenzhouxiangella sp. AB-CW3]QOC23229.1 hypothetical protein IC757_03490 [Wenzhouxiangella sp. AB-CW3]
MQQFDTDNDRQEVALSLDDFDGVDVDAVTGIAFAFVTGPQAGSFAFDLADVRLE